MKSKYTFWFLMGFYCFIVGSNFGELISAYVKLSHGIKTGFFQIMWATFCVAFFSTETYRMIKERKQIKTT